MTARQVFFVDTNDMVRFRAGQIVDDRDRHGEPIKGRVLEVKSGNKVALVVVETAGAT